MHDPLEEAKGVLDDLELNLKKGHAIWEGLRELNPDWEQISLQEPLYTDLCFSRTIASSSSLISALSELVKTVGPTLK